ncbi:uncharacterized protein LOC135147130 [Daucus carota subsp. sativus]|uniref:uncharacterized protein LOC135147130 n=1 Tax=Daucus carota subsp. sativus TaxID=79200 RepID=UPI003082D507
MSLPVMSFHEHIFSIDTSKLTWTLKVRVTRMWSTLDNQGNVVRHNMILLDCVDMHIHAIVRPEIWNQINPNVLEGGLYIIRNFQTTTIKAIPVDDFAIHLHKFEIAPLSILEELIESDDPEYKPRYAADVVGVLHALQPIQIIRSNNVDNHVVCFSISDGRISIPVHFFGPPNENTESLYGHDLQNQIIVILACVRISRFGERIHITNLPGSKIYINLQYRDVTELRQRLAEDEDQNP